VIHGLNVNLRAVERSDARLLAELLNQSSVQTGWGTGAVPVSVHRIEQDIEQWLEIERTTQRPACLIIETLEHEPIGALVIVESSRVGQSTAALSIAIHPDRQAHGYGRDALAATIEALFDDWNIHRIELTCEAGNELAARMYEALGFVLEATRREATYMNGAYHDQHLYGLLSTDPRPNAL
jgi:[ribosomal protein S5]-alanine N-acetyltransferase